VICQYMERNKYGWIGCCFQNILFILSQLSVYCCKYVLTLTKLQQHVLVQGILLYQSSLLSTHCLHYLYSVFILWNRRNACTSKPA